MRLCRLPYVLLFFVKVCINPYEGRKISTNRHDNHSHALGFVLRKLLKCTILVSSESVSTKSVIASPCLLDIYGNCKSIGHHCNPNSSMRSHGRWLMVTNFGTGGFSETKLLALSSILSCLTSGLMILERTILYPAPSRVLLSFSWAFNR